MSISKYAAPVQLACYDNQAFIPELWARESIAILFENMVVANQVHRDFEQEIANYGDTVHTRRPDESKIMRRTDVTSAAGLIQATNSVDVPVKLDQWFNQTFVIYPGEMSKSFLDLVQVYLAPRMKAMARSIDRSVLGRAAVSFGATPQLRAGHLNGLTAANIYQTCVEVDQIFNQNKAYEDGRNLFLSPSAKAQMLLCDKFVKAMERGDGGQTLATAEIGSVLNLHTFMCQNVNSVLLGADYVSFATDATPEPAEYAGAFPAVALSTTATDGEYCVVAGNDQPTWIVSHVDSTSFTLNEPLKYAIQGASTVQRYKACAVATGGSQQAGWSEAITLSGYSTGKAPQIGQLLAFGTSSSRRVYTVIESTNAGTTCQVLLDRPLELAITAADPAFPGPMGSINIAMHKNAMALVTRPLATVAGAGMMCAVESAEGIGVRVAMQDMINVGRVVSIDMLAGVALLDWRLGVPMLG